jgi:hypothetical protein
MIDSVLGMGPLETNQNFRLGHGAGQERDPGETQTSTYIKARLIKNAETNSVLSLSSAVPFACDISVERSVSDVSIAY